MSVEEFFEDVFQNNFWGSDLHEGHPLWTAYLLWKQQKEEMET